MARQRLVTYASARSQMPLPPLRPPPACLAVRIHTPMPALGGGREAWGRVRRVGETKIFFAEAKKVQRRASHNTDVRKPYGHRGARIVCLCLTGEIVGPFVS